MLVREKPTGKHNQPTNQPTGNKKVTQFTIKYPFFSEYKFYIHEYNMIHCKTYQIID